jgi:endonuclease YncB( thermonuclease family)
MPQATLTKRKTSQPSNNTYTDLVRAIRQTINLGKERASQAVERELVRTKWETGKLILEHILLNKDRADYGAKIMPRLSRDLSVSARELAYMLSFAREYPILPSTAKLNWAQYRELISVNDEDKRREIAGDVARKKMTLKQTRAEIKKLKTSKQITVAKKPAPEKLPATKPGQLGLYSICKMNGTWCRDLGFSVYQILKDQNAKTVNPPEKDLYTYEADVTEVVDGDTYHCVIQLGFDMILEQRVRLRRLDAPEVLTSEGQQAKKVLQKILNRAQGSILIKVRKTDDQYGRYLVDTWVNGINIDQELLDSGVFEVRG